MWPIGKIKIPEIVNWWWVLFSFLRWTCCFPSFFEVWILWREHWVLVGLRGLQENKITPKADIESKENLQWLHWKGGSQRGKEKLLKHKCSTLGVLTAVISLNSWHRCQTVLYIISPLISGSEYNCLFTKLENGTSSVGENFSFNWGNIYLN